ncbi:hypothetical protein TPL01_26480 [Sulfuriferula plumbiphila]|uniref:Uncharacterized protein n=1 Tax=Sulfuriferula plumbiphila TaxID=171865 RepID=A0A512LAK5_9PROT|nr:hypothetical protein [Sulfuriferula plumbiphila]BBP04923.1 hypothetical protein SFPGR_23450 [Sulfuriferula plumbiphila]GEP31510.1 hypothetical protein TPL01_26480 [Sulfuriferula plumbiphila]
MTAADTSEQTPAAAPKHRLNHNILGMGLTSLFSGWNHQMATSPNAGFAVAAILALVSALMPGRMRFPPPAAVAADVFPAVKA